MEYLHELLKELDSATSPSKYLIAKVFKAFKKSKIRRPDVYAIYGPNYCKSLGQVEKFSFFEHVFIGALDHGDLNLARSHLDVLEVKFPESSRVSRLRGMLAEAEGDFDTAMTIYDKVLEASPSNLLVMKRKVACLRSQGKSREAAESLHAIVKVFQSDVPSWLELADLHLSLCDYQSAAYCYEEVLLVTPTSAPAHCRLAEVLYTLGGAHNLITARQHYSMSLTHQGPANNRRALMGLLATCAEILALPAKRVPEGEADVTEAMQIWTREHLQTAAAAGAKGAGRLVAEALLCKPV